MGKQVRVLIDLCLEVFVVTKFNKIFLERQPCRSVEELHTLTQLSSEKILLNLLGPFDRKVLQKTFSSVLENGCRKRGKNSEIYKLCNGYYVVKFIALLM
jgi:hypothetical protein